VLTTLEGCMGSGKTLTATALAYSEHMQNGKRVIANYKLNFPFTFFEPIYFLQHIADEELTHCVHIIDEVGLLADSRLSGSKLNRLFTYYFAQTRKRNVDLYICTQHIDLIDKRLRRAADIRGTCSYLGENPCRKCGGSGRSRNEVCDRCLGYGVTGWATTRFVDFRRQAYWVSRRTKKIRVFGPAFWGLYDTEERIPILQKALKIPVEDL